MAHPGTKATCKLIRTRYFWPTAEQDVKKWCAECLDCQASKVGNHTKKQIQELPHPTQRFTDVHIDIVGPLENPEPKIIEISPRYRCAHKMHISLANFKYPSRNYCKGFPQHMDCAILTATAPDHRSRNSI